MASVDHDRLARSGLTRNQLFIWLAQEDDPSSPLFNELMVLVFDGPVDPATFERSLQVVVEGADALRTVVRRVDGFPRAEVLESPVLPHTFVDLSTEHDAEAALQRWARHCVDVPVDLAQHSFASTLLKLSETRYVWGLLAHQLLSDAASLQIIVQRLDECYGRLARGETVRVAESPSYSEYVADEMARRSTDRFRERERFWKSRTVQPVDPVTWYDGRRFHPVHGQRLERVEVALGSERSDAIRGLSARDGIRSFSEDVSYFNIFSAAFATFLFRLSGLETVVFGVPWHNRRRASRDTVGLFMEQNPFFVSLEDRNTFQDVIQTCRSETFEVMRHLPYAAGNPAGRVYDATLNFTKVSRATFADMPMKVRWYRPTFGYGSLGLQVHDFGATGEFSLAFEFNTGMFSPQVRERAVRHFLNCLDACIEDPSQEIGSITLVTDHERDLLFGDWNATERAYPKQQTVVDLFRANVDKRPESIAARCGDGALSYEALDQRVRVVAGRLRSLGVGPGVVVGLFLDRSIDLVVGLLAILDAGGIYLPLDPAFPSDRRDFMLDDSGAQVLVSHSDWRGTLAAGERDVLWLDEWPPEPSKVGDSLSTGAEPGPDDLAYVLYTSGSTGTPKGVEVSHRALANFMCSMRTEPGCSDTDVLLAVTTVSFDISLLELLLPLIVGGQVVVAERALTGDARLLCQRLEAGDVTMLQATPSTFRMLLDAGWSNTPSLRALIGGEPLPPDLVAPVLERTASLWNMYGPTETTIWSSVVSMTGHESEITIGTPIANTTFRVLDDRRQPVPVGVAGELYIGGDGVANGYRGRRDLSDARFVADPFGSRPDARMYRTGDLARYRDDGQLVHLGRVDRQVKVRGFRIELGEIEAALVAHPSVARSVVSNDLSPSGRNRLIAYCVPESETLADSSVLRDHLRATLPEYMLPHQFVTIDSVPLTPSGKIDHVRLPKLAIAETGGPMPVAPRTPTEEVVAAEFAKVLELSTVGIDDDFFDLGGDSLVALRLIVGLEAQFACRLPLRLLHETSTVAQLSHVISEVRSEAAATSATTRRGAGGDGSVDTQETLVEIFHDVLGVESIAVDDRFDQIEQRVWVGELLAEVRRRFGVVGEGISSVELEAQPTIAGLAAVIDARRELSSDLVVRLQPEGSRAPIFLFHAAGGYVFFYRALAVRLGPDHPVYAVRARTRADGGGRPYVRTRSVEELASSYVDEIRSIRPVGPYRLGGASFGGVIAFEVARQLREQGETVISPIVLFDSFVSLPEWLAVRRRGGSEPTLRGRVAARLGQDVRPDSAPTWRSIFATAPAVDVVRAFAKLVVGPLAWHVRLSRPVGRAYWMVQRLRLRGATGDVVQEKALDHAQEATFHLLKRYRPRPASGSAVLFRSADGEDPELPWRPLFPGGLEVHTKPGVHLDMIEEPAVVETAEILKRLFDEGPAEPR